MAEGLDQWPESLSLGVQSTMQELTDAIRSLANGKAVGPDGVSVELFKITLNEDPALRRRLLDIIFRIWRGGEVPQQWKDAIEPFNDWGGRGCHKFVPVLGGDCTKMASPGDLFDKPLGEMS